MTRYVNDRTFRETSTADMHISESLAQAATGIYVAMLAHFDLREPIDHHD